MIAVDTNVLVRLITADDAAQARRAARLVEREQVWVAKTVLLETDWVLRSLYRFPAREVAMAMQRLAGLASLHLEDPLAIAQALSLVETGLDFPDGLHLASRGEAERFATFDAKFSKKAARLGIPTLLL